MSAATPADVVQDAAEAVRRDGVAVLRDVIPRPRIAAALAALKARRLSPDTRDGRLFQPAPLRPRIAIPLQGPFADPAVFAPPAVLDLARSLLGDEMIIGELGVVISRPGDAPLEARRAAVPLFGGLDVERDVPPAALTMLAPLQDAPLDAGFPEYWAGSHRSGKGTAAPPFTSAVEAGSVVISDWRTLYRAGQNTSGVATMGFYVSFQRKWLLSLSGSDYRPGLSVPAASLKGLPQTHQRLVSWALHQNKTDDVSEFVHLWLGRTVSRLQRARGG